MKRSVLFLSDQPPVASHQGSWNRVHQTFQFFKAAGYEIYLLLCPADHALSIAAHAHYRAISDAVDYLSIVHKRPDYTRSVAAAHHLIDDWWDAAIGTELEWLFAVRSFDVMFVNYVFHSKAFTFAPRWTVKVLDTHDMFSGRREMLERHGAAPQFFYTQPDQERIGFDRADIVIAIKPSECAAIRQITDARTICVPYAAMAREQPAGRPGDGPFTADRPLVAGFIGSENAVNFENLRNFIPLLADHITQCGLPIVFHIAGNVHRRLGVVPAFVRILGPVEDVRAFYEGIDVVVVPFEFSTGTKVKIGEALSFGKPVVSTGNGFDGFVACHPAQQLASLHDVCVALGDIAAGRLALADVRQAGERSALLSAAAAQAGLATLARCLAAAPRVVIRTGRRFWQRACLLDEWISQWVELLAAAVPVSIACADGAALADGTKPAWLDALHVDIVPAGPPAGGDDDAGAVSFMVARGSEQWDVTAEPTYVFLAREQGCDNLPEIGVASRTAHYPLAPMRYVPGFRKWHMMQPDRSHILLMTADPGSEWEAIVAALIGRAAAARGITVARMACTSQAAFSADFLHDLMNHLPQPTLFVGARCLAWSFVCYLLDLGEIPHLQLAADGVLPVARSPAGLPSLRRAIEAFLDGTAPRAAHQPADAGWHGLEDALFGAAAGRQ